MAESRPVILKSNSSFSAALRRGDAIETHRKWAAGQNKQHVIEKNTAKLDEETEDLHNETVDLDTGKLIMQIRQEKGLTQRDLATKINEKPQVIADFEQGRALKSQTVLNKLERVLGVKLRGKDKGKPLSGPKKK